jgi:hypothetical protein
MLVEEGSEPTRQEVGDVNARTLTSCRVAGDMTGSHLAADMSS